MMSLYGSIYTGGTARLPRSSVRKRYGIETVLEQVGELGDLNVFRLHALGRVGDEEAAKVRRPVDARRTSVVQ